jgi:hypothetical protein
LALALLVRWVMLKKGRVCRLARKVSEAERMKGKGKAFKGMEFRIFVFLPEMETETGRAGSELVEIAGRGATKRERERERERERDRES